MEKENSKCSSIYNLFTEISLGLLVFVWIILGVISIHRVIGTEIVCHTIENTHTEFVVICIEED